MKVVENKQKKNSYDGLVFDKQNLLLMLIGLVLLALGFILMSGGGNTETKFDDQQINSFRRITLAPILVILGFGLELYAIFHKSKPNTNA